MKTKSLNMDWLVPFVGIAVVVGGVVAGKAYLDWGKRNQAAEARTVMLDRIYQGHQLSMALRAIHNGELNGATQRLDLLLCQGVLQTDAELVSADTGTKAYVEDSLRRLALVRPMIAQGTPAGSRPQCTDDQLAAERILTKLLASTQTAQAR